MRPKFKSHKKVTVKKTAVIQKCEKKDIDPDRPKSEQQVCLYTKDGSRLLGRHPDAEAAEKQEVAIKINQNKGAQTTMAQPATINFKGSSYTWISEEKPAEADQIHEAAGQRGRLSKEDKRGFNIGTNVQFRHRGQNAAGRIIKLMRGKDDVPIAEVSMHMKEHGEGWGAPSRDIHDFVTVPLDQLTKIPSYRALEKKVAAVRKLGKARITLAMVDDATKKKFFKEQWGKDLMKAIGGDPEDAKTANEAFWEVWDQVLTSVDEVAESLIDKDTKEIADESYLTALTGISYFVTNAALMADLGVKYDGAKNAGSYVDMLFQVLAPNMAAEKSEADLETLKKQMLDLVAKEAAQVSEKALAWSPPEGEEELPEAKAAGAEKVAGYESDESVATELKLYIDNEYDLYQKIQAIYKNMARKIAAGKYDSELAVKAFDWVVAEGARKYNKEFGSGGHRIPDYFPKSIRKMVATELRDEFEAMLETGELDDLLDPHVPKKYQDRKPLRLHGTAKKTKRQASLRKKADVDQVRIYIADLEAYNAGRLVGEWVDLPADEDELQEVIDKLSHGGQHDWAIHDYEAPFTIEEYGDIFKMNEVLQEAEDNYWDLTMVGCAYEQYGDWDSVVGLLEDASFYEGSNEEELGMNVIDSIYGDDIPDGLAEQYFDYEAYGRDLSMDLEDSSYYGGGSYSDLAYEFIDSIGSLKDAVGSRVHYYFDYEKYGRDLTYEGFHKCGDGYIYFS